MAAVYPVQFKGSDRAPFTAWQERCQALGVASTMTDCIRLAVALAAGQTDEQIRRGSGKHES